MTSVSVPVMEHARADATATTHAVGSSIQEPVSSTPQSRELASGLAAYDNQLPDPEPARVRVKNVGAEDASSAVEQIVEMMIESAVQSFSVRCTGSHSPRTSS
jgi:hypothetical protein